VFRFWFVFFWQKEIGTKVASKMLVKLTPVVNFSCSLRAAFSLIILYFADKIQAQTASREKLGKI